MYFQLQGQRNVTANNKTQIQYIKWSDGYVVGDAWKKVKRTQSSSWGEMGIWYIRFTNKTCTSEKSTHRPSIKPGGMFYL